MPPYQQENEAYMRQDFLQINVNEELIVKYL